MKNIELVIFDMDGLMLDTESVSKKAWMLIGELNNYNITYEFLLSLIGKNRKSVELAFKNHFGEDFPFAYLYELKEIKASQFIVNEGLRIKEGLIELIDYLIKNEIKIAVATSSYKKKAYKLLKMAGVFHLFNKVLCGDEILKGKPNPEIFLTICQDLKVKPSKALVLEDSQSGLEAAVAGGITCIIVPDLVEPSEKHVKLAYSKVKNLKEVIKIFST